MAVLPSPSSQLTLHIADRALTPILSTSRSPSSSSRRQSQTQAQALSSLTAAATSAYDSASRLGLGVPQRIMIETDSSGPIILHSYLNPQLAQRPRSRRTQSHGSGREIVQQAQDELRLVTASGDMESSRHQEDGLEVLVNGVINGDEVPSHDSNESGGGNAVQPPPLLIATVLAPSAADAGEARRAAASLERTGREFQREWAREQDAAQQPAIAMDSDLESG